MTRQQMQLSRFAAGLALAAGLVLAAPAAFGDVYTWRTEDGGYAYTDDLDQVPPRYALDAKVVKTGKLENYERYQELQNEPDETVGRWIIDLRRRVGVTETAQRVAQEGAS